MLRSLRNLLVLVLFVTMSATAGAYTFPWEHITGSRTSSPYWWYYSYDIGFYNNVLMVDVDIKLTGYDPSATVKGRWENGMESVWSTNRFSVPISFNVDWVTTNYDQLVTVTDSTGRWNMSSWYTQGAGGWGDAYQEKCAAHEFGHMLSMYDEYSGGAIDPVTHRINTSGVMCTLDGGTLDYYYDPFLGWYQAKLASVPEPGSLFLLLAGGLCGIMLFRKKRTSAA
jgi:hypothetical protein